jgi:F-type H+-transporting ATPase subunit alpha
VDGLPSAQSEELIAFPGGVFGMALNLDTEEIAVALLDRGESIQAGQEVRRTGRVVDVPVGDALLGRVVDPLGRPLDGDPQPRTNERRPIEREAAAIMDRDPVSVPLQTGIQSVDSMIPVGRGQRELILGDRQTGKTAIAVDAMINQRNFDVLNVYCAVGQRRSAVARVVEDLRNHGVMEKSVVVAVSGEDTPGLNFAAPYAAMSIAEYFMDNGADVLVVFDDLTRHARAYRELSLLLRRPPAREAYPGDIFYIHSRLLERSTHVKEALGGGSITALPIIETQAQNISAYIPTNLVSITDGQIYLSPTLFQEGVLPAVDVGQSVSRVGGDAQLPAYKAVVKDLRLSYSQFQELESFARFGVRLEEETKRALERGRRVREVLKQDQYAPIPVSQQIAVLLAVTEGVLDSIVLDNVGEAVRRIRTAVQESLPNVSKRIEGGESLSDDDTARILDVVRDALSEEDRG